MQLGSLHLDHRPGLNGREDCTHLRHSRHKVVQSIGGSHYNNDCHREPSQVLLIMEILVGCEEHRKGLCPQQLHQLPIPFACPSHLHDGTNLVVREFASERSGNALIKQYAHAPSASLWGVSGRQPLARG
jgi:hypothetical protein